MRGNFVCRECETFICRKCEKISQAPAQFHVLPRGFASPPAGHDPVRGMGSISRSIGSPNATRRGHRSSLADKVGSAPQ